MAESYTKEEINEFREAFALYNSKRDGKLLPSEVGNVMRACGKCPSESQVQDIIKEFGWQTGCDFKSFLMMMERYVGRAVQTEESIREAFAVFDKRKTGFVDVQEIRHVLAVLGEKMSKEELDRFIKAADDTGKGKINYAAFAKKIAPEIRG
eukprot:CAMPEP_0177654570 /NCGR_PEP_ID=MMETSP0447-20121125/14411_1 /TAXON_ID=0 /ORGANISM="Stygamoeba regulata, Strain BSH-02190019" /LENGTH=151 /DNA_ID=CAMNT_0019158245 /DNA_START=55 /DNA_END=510 /DNA_ORIENTATION=-